MKPLSYFPLRIGQNDNNLSDFDGRLWNSFTFKEQLPDEFMASIPLERKALRESIINQNHIQRVQYGYGYIKVYKSDYINNL